MKIKLLFYLVIVFCCSCSEKTYQNTDYDYYKSEMAKSKKRQQDKELIAENKSPVVVVPDKVSYLSGDDITKYANKLGVSKEDIKNEKLYHTINSWLGTPYLWGGDSKSGIDCSAFVQEIYHKVYQKELPRTSIEQFYMDTKVHFKDQQYLKEGDLVFFRLRHKDKVVSHVGIYLQNGMFLGSNSPRGVEIVNLNSSYWQDKYVASSRLLNN